MKFLLIDIGNVKLRLFFELKNVLHVHGFRFNIFSIPKMCQDDSCIVQFTHNKCILHGPLMSTSMVLGELDHGLYKLSKEFQSSFAMPQDAKAGKIHFLSTF